MGLHSDSSCGSHERHRTCRKQTGDGVAPEGPKRQRLVARAPKVVSFANGRPQSPDRATSMASGPYQVDSSEGALESGGTHAVGVEPKVGGSRIIAPAVDRTLCIFDRRSEAAQLSRRRLACLYNINNISILTI